MPLSYSVEPFFDEDTWTVTYVVYDPATRDAIVIDPVLDYDPQGSVTTTRSLDRVTAFLRREELRLHASLETHAHADHLSGSRALARLFGAKVGIGRDITLVQETFRKIYNLPASTKVDGSQFDLLLAPYETVRFGSIELVPLPTPGHTPACQSYRIGDAVFTGDALFLEDYGTGRTDFPAGSAEALYESVTRELYSLPPSTRVFVGHDYLPGGRPFACESTVEKERLSNVQLSERTTREEFIAFRESRDKSLKAPRLLFQSVLVNVFGGTLPDPEENGTRYLKIPINLRRPIDEVGLPLPKGGAS